MKLVFGLLFFLFVSVIPVTAQNRIDPCKIFGAIYIEKDKYYADFKVYIEENDAFANIAVFKHANRFFADRSGQWYITPNKQEADFWIYIEPNKGMADFSIAYIDTESFAGCK